MTPKAIGQAIDRAAMGGTATQAAKAPTTSEPIAMARTPRGIAAMIVPETLLRSNETAVWLAARGLRFAQLRTQHLDLAKQTWGKQKALLESIPSLLLVSRHVYPQPADWPPPHRVTGYLFDEDDAWQPPQDLLDFLAEGEKPIYIGFGSMRVSKPEATTRLVLQAVQSTGKRAILLSGWAGIGALDLPKDVFLLKYAPHTWLFPRMAATVHHGGAGTTAAGLRAGVPAIIIPFFVDQPYWAQRVYDLGVGTKPIPRTKLTADKLAAAIQEATSNCAMQDKVAELGKKIAAEDGIGAAVKAIQEFLA